MLRTGRKVSEVPWGGKHRERSRKRHKYWIERSNKATGKGREK